VTGIILGAFGFGSFIFGLLSTWIINPQNLKPTVLAANGSMFFDETISARVPTFFYILAGCFSVLAFFGILLIRNKTESPSSREIIYADLGYSNMLNFGEGMRHH
jgi:hypothetical protein